MIAGPWEPWGTKECLPPPNFLNTNVFFIIKNDKKKQKKFNVLKTEIQYHLHKMSLNKTSNISGN